MSFIVAVKMELMGRLARLAEEPENSHQDQDEVLVVMKQSKPEIYRIIIALIK